MDVGTGFYVEKSVDDANKFYNEKTKELGNNLKELEGVLQGRSNNLRVVEDGMYPAQTLTGGYFMLIAAASAAKKSRPGRITQWPSRLIMSWSN